MPRRAAMLATVVIASGCADAPTAVVLRDDARLVVQASLTGTAVRAFVIEVTAPDIPTALVFNLAVQGDVATGSITLPAGSDRFLVARAFDQRGVESHRGRRTLQVRAGANDAVAINLMPLQGDQPIELTVGSYTISVAPGSAALGPGETVRLDATVRDADGNVVSDATIHWASLDLAVATITPAGLVTARAAGTTQVVAVCGGTAAAVTVTVQAP
jgi:hypothetical protein